MTDLAKKIELYKRLKKNELKSYNKFKQLINENRLIFALDKVFLCAY